jgi:Domain of unknown function (DUF1707)
VIGRRADGEDRVRDLDRERALSWVEALEADGTIRGEEEKKIRVRRIRGAVTQADLEAALAGLPPLGHRDRAGDLRASNEDRDDAIRRLRAHEALGHLDPAETRRRAQLVEDSRTANDISLAFVDLPGLQTLERSAEARVTDDERLSAIEQLDEARINGQLTDKEHTAKIALVDAARTRTEIRAALRGLKDPRRIASMKRGSEAAAAASSAAARLAVEGALRARAAVMRLVLAVAAILVAVIAGVVVSPALGAVCLVAGVVLAVSSVRVLIRRR